MDSLRGQTWKDTEILWINDGSVDGSGKICDEFAKDYENVRVIHTENRGVSAARNLGLEEAKGEYVTFVDADDCLAADMLEHLAYILEKTGCDVAGCGFWEFGSTHSLQKEKEGQSEAGTQQELFCNSRGVGREANSLEVLDGLGFMEKGILGSDTRCWSKLYRKESIGDIRFDRGLTIGEDMLFLLELARAGRTFGRSSYRGYGYFINDEGAMMHKFKDSYMDQILCWERALPVLEEASPKLKDKAEAVLLVSTMLVAGKLSMLSGKERKEKQAFGKRCLDVVREYGGHKGAFWNLDRGYRIKVSLFRWMPGGYMWLYHWLMRAVR